MIFLGGVVALAVLIIVVLGYVLVLLYRNNTKLEKERDDLQDILEGSGIVWSDVSDEATEATLDRLLERIEQEEEEEELPGHGGRWDEAHLSRYD